jgi:large subunit ribosomal protein L10
MVLKVDGKQIIVDEVAAYAQKAPSLFAAEYSGMTVKQMTELRKTARTSGMYVRVVRNTLARRALEGTKFASMRDNLVGPLLLAFSGEDPGAAARLLQDFSKKCDKLKMHVLSLGSQTLASGDLAKVAAMPTREQALGQLLGTMMAPIAQFVRTLAEPHAQMVRCFAAVGKSKEGAN